MKKKELIRQLQDIARSANLDFVYVGGAKHEKCLIGELTIVIPRHNEIKEMTAQAILKSAMTGLGGPTRKDTK